MPQDTEEPLSLVFGEEKCDDSLVGWRQGSGEARSGGCMAPRFLLSIKDPSALDLHDLFPQRAQTMPTTCLLAHTFP